MPVARFEMPDGRVARFEVPEGTTPEQAQTMIGENIDSLIPKAEPTSSEPSFTERVRSDFDKRNLQAEEIQAAADSGQQGALQTGLQIVGLGAGKVNDVIGEAMTSVGQGISAITPDMIKEPISEAATSAIESDAGQAALSGAGYVADKYGQLKQEFPNAMRSVEAAGNIVGAVPVSLGALKGGQKAVTSVGEKVADVATTKKRNLATQIGKKEASSDAYKAALESGEVFPSDFSGKMAETGKKYLPKTEFQAKLMAGSPSNRMAELVQEFNGKPLTIEDVDLLDKKLTDEAFGLWNSQPSEAKKISEIQDSLRETLSAYPVGGKLKEARDLWAQQAKMRDLMKIQEVAEMTDNPATSIKSSIRTLIKNEKRFNSYTPEEKELLQKAAKTGLVTDALRVAGSRLNAIGAGVSTGNPAVAGAVYGAGALARKGAEKIQGGKLNKVIQAVSDRPIGQAEKAVESASGKAPKYPAMEPMRDRPRYTPPTREEIRRPNLKTTIKNLANDESGSVGGVKTKTPEFKKWFGDSKVVDDAGEPITVYHGTSSKEDFTEFRKPRARKNDNSYARDRTAGTFFSSEPAAADFYSDAAVNSRTIPAYLSIQKPLIHNFNGRPKDPKMVIEMAKRAKKEGYDGLLLKNVRDTPTLASEDVYVAFSPTQIKSIHNKGSFDPNDANIMAMKAPLAVSGATGAAALSMQPQEKKNLKTTIKKKD